VKRFDIITESDARMLEPGETVELARNGHITPLARDTLMARRVTVVHEGRASAEESRLVPAMPVRSIAIGSDHTGIALRRALVTFLRGQGLAVTDLGTDTAAPVDYPDVAAGVAEAVARGEADAGLVIDGAGVGSAIAANKVNGIRAAMASSERVARYSREHHGANVLALGATLVTPDEARAIVAAWLGAEIREPRYIRRLAKIEDIERRQRKTR
jgi:ribose 5-phosphate isomerase B